ncbi:PTS mannose transporter subunit IIAB [Candidatus Profftia tarda]|uniref:PTS system mannose-specific EIIAB component n=1 Tax=Candidatus Profftia tarda TaxID=1177216 RepID=A0A8E4GI99_9ENTR|nr:PTS mannose transporter subunit IIAB [Candidatus Profftia tarda]CAD6510904.1 PTS system mannose-specific EIIAB component [Candidatus Profftia tarda]
MSSVAIIIGTHGAAAEQLLKTAEMLIGKQSNVAFIDFVPGENAETLIEKYTERLRHLKSSKGVIFLVDTWGGSPFNAASSIVINKDNHQVITGVNIPMLVEIFMARDDDLSFDELVVLALKTGREGIRILYAPKAQVPEPHTKIPVSKSLKNLTKTKDNMQICLARIDDRLIHGQVATCWTKEARVSRIIVVSNEVSADNTRSTLLKQVAPPGITAHIVNIEKMIRVYSNPDYVHDRVMLLFTNPTDVVRLVESGIRITSINIGGMAFRHGKIQITTAVSVDEKDIIAFKKLDSYGIELEIRKVPNESPLKMIDLIKKINKS